MTQTQTKFTKQELANAAKEMIDVLELENDDGTPIQVDEKNANQSRQQILEFWELVEQGDGFSPETAETLQKLGFNPEVNKQQQSSEEAEQEEETETQKQEAKSEAKTQEKKKSGKSDENQKKKKSTESKKPPQTSGQGKSKGPPKIGRAKVLSDILFENITKTISFDYIAVQMQSRYGGTTKESEKATKHQLAVLYNLGHIDWNSEGNIKYKV